MKPSAIYPRLFTLAIVLCAVPHWASAAPDRLDLYTQSVNTITDASPAVDPVTDKTPPTNLQARAARYSLARHEAWLKSNARGFALFQQALRTPIRPRPAQAGGGAMKVLAHEYGDMRQLARYKVIEANTREMRRDWGGAMQSRLDIYQLAHDTSADSSIIGSYVTRAIEQLAQWDLGRLQNNLTLAQTKAATARLQALYSRRLRLAVIVEGERQSGLKMLNMIFKDPKWRQGDWSDMLTEAQLADMKKSSSQTMLRRYAVKMDRLRRVAGLPYRQLRAQPRKFNRQFEDLQVPGLRAPAFSFACADSTTAMWLASLALQAYKQQHGAYPASLAALAPQYLRQVPLDPFSGTAPLRYRRTARAYDLWSIGPDGVDDGGKPIGGAAPSAGGGLPRVQRESKGDMVAGKNR